MLTRITPGLPSAVAVQVSGNTLQGRVQSLEQQLASLATEHNRLLDAVRSAFEDLNREGALDIADAAIVASRGIKFPATQTASTDVNTLDDYEESNTSGTSTSVAPGGGAFTATATYTYTKAGNLVAIQAVVVITNVGTGTGVVNVDIPFVPAATGAVSAVNTTSGIGLSGVVFNSAGQGKFQFFKPDGTSPIAVATLIGETTFRV